MTTDAIRPFRPEDRAAILEFQNSERPPHLHETVAEWERADARKPPGEVWQRLCIGEPPIAFMGVRDLETTAYRTPETCGFNVHVAPAHRGRGLGAALYEKTAGFARERGSKRLRTYMTLYRPDEPGIWFLEKRGFAEVDREVPVMLDLTTFDPAPHVRPLPDGLRLLSLADVGDTEENRRKVYALDGLIHPDVPTHDVVPELPDFAQWNKMLDGPEYDPRAVILAENSVGEWVGLSALGFQEHTNIAWTNITGVRRDCRGKGLALALKLAAIAAAKHRGCTLILTENHEDNAPMRAINKKLGFTPDAPAVSYAKTLEEAP